MGYRLRFVQRFDKSDMEPFLELEKKFLEWEKAEAEAGSGIPAGRRFVPVTGRDPINTLIYEAELPTLEAAAALIQAIEGNPAHDALVAQQGVYMKDYYVEILREL